MSDNVVSLSPTGLSSFNHRALHLLATGLADDFIEVLQSDEKVIEAFHDCVAQFISERIDFVNEEAAQELAFLLVDRVNMVTARY